MTGRWKTILAIDFDPHAAATDRANFPGVEVSCASVADEIGGLPYADVILGGPPCQPFSHAGKRAGKDDARDCVPDFLAAVRMVQPRMFLMEEVPGFLSIEEGRYSQRLFAAFGAAGYVVQLRVLDAVAYGVPQFRERVWFWGIRTDLYAKGVRHRWPAPTHQWPWPEGDALFGGCDLLPAATVGWGLDIPHRQRDGVWFAGSGEPCTTLPTGDNHANAMPRIVAIRDAQNETDHGVDEPCGTIQGNAQAKGGGAGHYAVHEYRWSDAMLAKHPPASPASPVLAKVYKGGAEGLLKVMPLNPDEDHRQYPQREDKPANTLGKAAGRPDSCLAMQPPAAKMLVRLLLPLECARIQSMPDDFVWPKISKTAQYRIIGNGQASGMTAALSVALGAADPESRTVLDLFCGGGVGAVGWHGRYWTYGGTR